MENSQTVTFRDSRNRGDSEGRIIGSHSGRWKLLIAAFITHVLGNSFILSYGIYMIDLIENEVPAWLAFATPIVFTISFTLTQTWCREVTESWSGNIGYRCMAAIGIFMVTTGMLIAAFTSSYLYFLNLGFLGGFGTCVFLTQVEIILYESFETHLAMARAICAMAQTAAQILAPQLIVYFIQIYGGSMAIFLHSAIVLQILPAVLYLKTDFIISRPRSISRYSDLSRMNSYLGENQHNGNDLQLVELNSKSWRSPADSGATAVIKTTEVTHNDFEEDDGEPCTPPPSPEERRKNLLGVEILPEIPEEAELSHSSDSDEDHVQKMRNRFTYDVKRLSVMSDKLDELILRHDIKCDSCKNSHGLLEASKISDSNNYQSILSESSLSSIETTYRLTPNFDAAREFAPYPNQTRTRAFGYFKNHVRLKRRISYCGYCINDTLFKPLKISLSFWRFYAALFLKVSTILVPVGVSSLMPLLAMNLINATLRGSSLLLTIYGFSWLCMMVASPWVTNMPKTYLKFVYVGGSFLSLAGLFIIADTTFYAYILIASTLLGLGQGAILLSSDDTIREWIGLRKWSKVRGTLEFFSCLGVAVVGGSMSYALTITKGVKHCFEILTLLQAVITFMWLIISISNIYFQKRHQSYEITPLPC